MLLYGKKAPLLSFVSSLPMNRYYLPEESCLRSDCGLVERLGADSHMVLS